MTPDQFNQRLERIINDFKNPVGRPPEDIILKLANDASAMVQRRVIGTGKDAKGQSFTPYSKGYAKKRKDTGHQTAHKSFLYSRIMWGDVKPTPVRAEGDVISVTVGPRKESERNKMQWNTDYENKAGRDNIMGISAEEEKFLVNTFNRWVALYFQHL